MMTILTLVFRAAREAGAVALRAILHDTYESTWLHR